MEPERWQQVKALFAAALDLPAEEQGPYLARHARDPDLRQEVEQLLAAHREAGTFIDRPALEDQGEVLDGADEPLGQRIGPYKLVRLLGRGGMGSVFLGVRDDDQFRKRVAIKLVKRGMDSEEVLRRFRSERQILASLEHPNIARLLDGGITPEGLPFFVMEHIEGEPIDVYCDRKKLGAPERLELFRAVCSAVQYAHQNLVVHRDLKPGNILVSEAGVPKLLDFGIARLLQPDLFPQTVLPTRTGLRLMTPEYASPEQVRGEKVNTASDVYSLGVLLYQLLTGRLPYRLEGRSLVEIERAICEEEPRRPSTAAGRRKLAGDLDKIALKALSKEPERRYASVDQLSEDIRRHLEGLPVAARGDSLSCLTARFVRRNRVAVAAVLLVLLSLVGGIVATVRQARIARNQRDLAVRAATTMVEELAEGMRRMIGPTEGRLGLLAQAEEVFADVSESGLATPDLQRRAAEASRVLSQTYLLLGDAERALRHATQGGERMRGLVAASDGTLSDRSTLASLQVEAGDALAALGKDREAQAAYEEAQALAEEVAADPAATILIRSVLPLVLQRQGDRAIAAGDLEEGEALFQRSSEITGQLFQKEGRNLEVLSLHAIDLERLGDLLYARGRVSESCLRYKEVVEIRRRARDLALNDPTVLQSLANSTLNLGWCEGAAGNLEKATKLYQEGIGLLRRLADNDPANAPYASMLIGGLGSLGGLYVTAERPAEALPSLQEAYERARALQSREPANPAVGQRAATVSEIYSRALRLAGRLDEAEPVAAFAVSTLGSLADRSPENVEVRRSLGYALVAQGKIRKARGDVPGAVRAFRQALETRQAVARSTGASQDKQIIAESHYQLATGLEARGDRDEARRLLLEGREILLGLRAAGQLSDDAEGWRVFLPGIESMLEEIR